MGLLPSEKAHCALKGAGLPVSWVVRDTPDAILWVDLADHPHTAWRVWTDGEPGFCDELGFNAEIGLDAHLALDA